MVDVYDFVSVQDKTNVREANDVHNIEQNRKCFFSDGTELVEKENIFNAGKLNFKLFVQ